MHNSDELIDHIRSLKKELDMAKDQLVNYDENYVHTDNMVDHAYDLGMIHRDDIPDHIDYNCYVDRDDYRSIERALESLAEAAEVFFDCEDDCSDCKQELKEALESAKCYV